MRNAVQLITYVDRLGGDLAGLQQLLATEPWRSAFAGVHLLPFFTPFDGADSGFDPVDHNLVDQRLGTWDDVKKLSDSHDTVVDLIVNHVSCQSAPFLDVQERGSQSPHAPMFLTFSSVFPAGATEAELAAIYRPRPGMPFTYYRWGDQRRLVWTTFTPQQVDIDIRSDAGQRYLTQILQTVAAAGVKMVRLDAVGYAVKTPGTSCFMTAETLKFIAQFTAQARNLGVEVLVEVHAYYQRQIEIGTAVDWVYDFALPPLLLHAVFTGDGAPLARWMQLRPTNAITVLDTHDGIGVIDVGPDTGATGQPGLLSPNQIDELVETIHERTAGASRLATGTAASNLDLYQVNSTYYDALGRDDHAYLMCRAVQMFLPGIPQVYYVGALAGGNDLELLSRTGVGRDVNRHYYDATEIAVELDRPVVKALMALARFRSTCPAFAGDFVFEEGQSGQELVFFWQSARAVARLTVDLMLHEVTCAWGSDGFDHTTNDLVANPPVWDC